MSRCKVREGAVPEEYLGDHVIRDAAIERTTWQRPLYILRGQALALAELEQVNVA